jgi:endoglucanase
MRKNSLEFLYQLLQTPSPSGFEAPVQRAWLDYVRPFADETGSDAYGNAFAILNPEGTPRVLLGGHGDELGFMVTYIDDDGFLYFQGIGGVDVSLIRGQRVWVHGAKEKVPGVTNLLAIHMQETEDRTKVPAIHKMCIDIGAHSKKEAEKIVRVGDAVTYATDVFPLRNQRIAARGCDNRIGIFAAAEGLRLAHEKRKNLKACVIAVSTIQEENGLYGAAMVAESLRPDVALVADVTHATDIPLCSKPRHGDVRLGKGPVISLGSACHPAVNARLEEVARREKISIQFEANPRRTGTDADAVFTARGGIPTTSLGLPNRYMHSPVEVVDLDDLEKLGRLMGEFAIGLKKGERFTVNL